MRLLVARLRSLVQRDTAGVAADIEHIAAVVAVVAVVDAKERAVMVVVVVEFVAVVVVAVAVVGWWLLGPYQRRQRCLRTLVCYRYGVLCWSQKVALQEPCSGPMEAVVVLMAALSAVVASLDRAKPVVAPCKLVLVLVLHLVPRVDSCT